MRNPIKHKHTDITLLFSTRVIRLFAYGFLSVILALYLAQIGLREKEIGLLFSFTLAVDAAISLWITTSADRLGRRRMLLLGAGLMIITGVVFIFTRNIVILMVTAVLGVISPSGYDIGPFLSIEQASLSQLVADERRTQVFAWYNLVGAFATALGSLAGGSLAHTFQNMGYSQIASYQFVLTGYAIAGLVLLLLFLLLSSGVEPHLEGQRISVKRMLGLHRSRKSIFKLSSLFALDSFAGGFIVQSILAYWFYIRFQVDVGTLGKIFFAANLLGGISGLFAAIIAHRIGLINTMVFTHLPSNLLLMLVPIMPTLVLAICLLLLRFSISQMDVPPRQSYIMAVVDVDERSAAAGITGISRSLGASISPAISGLFLSNPLYFNLPLFLAGGLKIVYDLLVYYNFKNLKPPEERES